MEAGPVQRGEEAAPHADPAAGPVAVQAQRHSGKRRKRRMEDGRESHSNIHRAGAVIRPVNRAAGFNDSFYCICAGAMQPSYKTELWNENKTKSGDC